MAKSSKKIFKSPEILEENNRENDYLDFSVEISRLEDKLNRIDKTSFIAVTAPHGSGKTTVLNQLWKKMEEADQLWMQFDAWKYPNRDELWQSFVLDFFRNFETELFKKALSKFDVGGDALKEAGSAISEKIGHLFKLMDILSNTTPVKRDFQVQELFVELIQMSTIKKAKSITIILEDIDRSGDSGTYFLETLSYFLKKVSNEESLPIFKVIVPMEENFLTHEAEKQLANKALYGSYLKVFDQVWKLDLSQVDYRQFIEELFTQEVKEKIGVAKLADFFHKIRVSTPREFQLHLRQIADLYDQYIKPEEALEWDIRIIFFIELNRSAGRGKILSNSNTGSVSSNTLGFQALESCVIDDRISKGGRSNYFFVKDENNAFSVPVYVKPAFPEHAGGKPGFRISDKYLSLI